MSSNSTELLLNEIDANGILRLTLNDAGRRNALSEAMLARLQDVLAVVSTDKATRVIVLAANGPAFCAGHDLKELTAKRSDPDRGQAYFTKIMSMCAGMMQFVVTCPKPVIAEVAGVATAAGCQLVASCDLAVAAETALFSTPGVNIGLFCSTPMVALSRNIASKHAMEMLLTGDMISAADAARMGLVNRVVAPGTERAMALELAQKIVSKSAHVIGIGKAAYYRQLELPLAEAYRYASEVMTENMMARDAEEGIGAFIEKRDPTWEDR
jgi:enoyl-CoA hydratase/carnithine racemase